MLFPRSFSLKRHYERIHINPRFIRNKGKKDQEIIKDLLSAEGTEKTTANDGKGGNTCGECSTLAF